MIFTLLFTVLVVVVTNVIALLLALNPGSKHRGKNVLRAASTSPTSSASSSSGTSGGSFFSRGFRFFSALTHLGIFDLSWLVIRTSVSKGRTGSVWQSLGFYMVIYIAGLQTVPRDQVEAA